MTWPDIYIDCITKSTILSYHISHPYDTYDIDSKRQQEILKDSSWLLKIFICWKLHWNCSTMQWRNWLYSSHPSSRLTPDYNNNKIKHLKLVLRATVNIYRDPLYHYPQLTYMSYIYLHVHCSICDMFSVSINKAIYTNSVIFSSRNCIFWG